MGNSWTGTKAPPLVGLRCLSIRARTAKPETTAKRTLSIILLVPCSTDNNKTEYWCCAGGRRDTQMPMIHLHLHVFPDLEPATVLGTLETNEPAPFSVQRWGEQETRNQAWVAQIHTAESTLTIQRHQRQRWTGLTPTRPLRWCSPYRAMMQALSCCRQAMRM